MWESAGIKGRPHFKALLYNEPARKLIAYFERIADGKWPIGEIYTRSVDQQVYGIVPGTSDLVSYHAPVSAADAPLIFFNELRLRTDLPGAADWGAVHCLDLGSGQMSTVVSAESIQVPEGCLRVWVSSVLSVDASGSRLFCRVAFEEGDEAVRHSGYWLCELPVDDPVPRKVTFLQNTFL